MSSQTKSNQRGVVVLLSILAIILAVLVGVMIWMFAGGNGNSSSKSASNSPLTVVFDPATATKVPEGMTPEQLVEKYSTYVVDGNYEEAYKLLPLGTQMTYGSASAFKAQLKDYGISDYAMGGSEETTDTFTIAAAQITPDLTVAYTWSFKKVDGQWYVESRQMMTGESSSSDATATK